MRIFIRWQRTTEGYRAWSDFRAIDATSVDLDYAINFVKGSVLHVIADYRHVPDVSFSVIAVLTPKPVRIE